MIIRFVKRQNVKRLPWRDNAFAATEHAPYHVTYAYGENFSHIFKIPDPDLAIRYTTCMALR